MRTLIALALALTCVLPGALPAAAHELRDGLKASLVTVEGTVSSVTDLPGEGDLSVVAISLASDAGTGEEITVLLAPRSALADIGFTVESGDHVRARVFSAEDGAAKAHKVLNQTRGTMVRLRTLRRTPLWDGVGRWQGGPCRAQGGNAGAGHRHRGGH
jgi:hypothetical protein